MDYLDVLVEGSQQLNILLGEHQIRALDVYLKQLRFFNKKFNLTAIIEPCEIVKKHFLDSLSIFKSGYFEGNKSVLDIGTGAGFPGLVLKIARPSLNFTLLEANRKKSLFLDHIISKLRLKNVSIVNLRAEEFSDSAGRCAFDIVITRAVSSLPVNMEYAVPALKIGGYYLAMKGGLNKEPATENACKELSCSLAAVKKVEVPFLKAKRNIVVFKKDNKTNLKYPRRIGRASKKPL